MLNSQSFDELAARIGKAIENSPAKDIEKNVKAMLASGLARLDLVPRAEFDVQTRSAAQDARKARSAGKARRRVRGPFPPPRRVVPRARRPDSDRAAARIVRSEQARRWRVAVVLSRGLAGLDAPLRHRRGASRGRAARRSISSGLPDTEVKESRDRVRAALQNAQFEFPARKITVNLAPADLPKESGRFDLPIALGILAATGQIPADRAGAHEFAGELALTGELRPIRGALPMALVARGATAARSCCRRRAPPRRRCVRDATVYPRVDRCSRCART